VKQGKPRFAFRTRNFTSYHCLECGSDLYEEVFTTLSSCAKVDNDRAYDQFIPSHEDTTSESYLALCHCILTQDPRVTAKLSKTTTKAPVDKLRRALIITSATTDHCKNCDSVLYISTVSGLTYRGHVAYRHANGPYKPEPEDTKAETYILLCPCALTTDPRSVKPRRIFSDSESD
jgi:hypothetical protein